MDSLTDVVGLPLFPLAPHSNDTTSREAAKSIVPHMDELCARVLDAIVLLGGGTDEQIQARLGMSGDTERPRRVWLVGKGLVKDSGNWKPTKRGRKAIVWVPV